jgi:hypothetical protein
MELEFDKEIDALLRGDAAAGGDARAPAGHADADIVALFAEGLLPATAREAHVLHFAECAKCRKLLSGVIALNSEAEEVPVALPAPAVAEGGSLPWYRRLFAMPNLAYVMGGLILVFGGFIALQVLQNTDSRSATEVSQVAEPEQTASGPNSGPEAFSVPAAPAASNAGGPNAANASANAQPSYANSNSAATTASNRFVDTGIVRTEDAKKIQPETADADEKPAAQPLLAAPPTAAAPKPEAKEKEEAERRDMTAAARARSEPTDSVANRSAETQRLKDDTRAGGPAKSVAGPARNMQRQFPNALGTANSSAATRRVGGKTFEYNGGAWYDSLYRGRPTVNVRRGTDEFRKLDEGLRSIAGSLSGTVVVVWKDKSYRID